MPETVAARSGVLCAWVGAWLDGAASADDVLRVATSSAQRHALHFVEPEPVSVGDATGWIRASHHDSELASLFSGSAGAGQPLSLVDVLGYWRRSTALVRVAFPVPGDVRGLGESASLRDAALAAGEAICGAHLGLVPLWQPGPVRSSAGDVLLWQVFRIEPAAIDGVSLADASHELSESIRLSASALARAQVGRQTEGMAAQLGRLRHQPIDLDLPAGFPPRAVALLAQAERMAAILRIAALDPIGGGVDREAANLREDVLRELTTSIRRARVAGYNALTERVSR